MSWSAKLKKVWPASVLIPEKMDDISTHISAAIDTLAWKLATQTSIKSTSVFCAPKQLKLHAYHATLVQELKLPELPHHHCFCHWFLNFVPTQCAAILNRVHFSGKAWFHCTDCINACSYRIWSSENPHVFHKNGLHPDKIGVCYVISQHPIIGLIFFTLTVSADIHQDMIMLFVVLLEMEDRDSWFQ